MVETAKRVMVAAPLVAVFGGVLVAGVLWLWLVLTLLAAVVAAKEWGCLAGLDRVEGWVYAALFAVLCLFGFFLLGLSPDGIPDGGVVDDGGQPPPNASSASSAAALLMTACLFWVVVAPLLLFGGLRLLPKVLLQVVGMVLLFITWMAGVLLFVADVAYLTAAVLVVVVADVAAYIFGKVFGKSQMAAAVSPGKTWEGFYGGVLAVLVLVVVGGGVVSDAPLAWLLAAGFALMVLSVVGDLFASMLKRQAGVKDSGILLGAHGGVIDRIDAMLPVLPCAAMLAGVV